jgi:hypothetical protein
MSANESQSSGSDPSNPSSVDNERIPGMQSMLDNPFLLLFIGVAMPTVFYLVWGIMEIVTLPVSP